jgi:hypothetical protein
MTASAYEHLNTSDQPEVKPVPSHRKNWFPGQTMLIPTAKQIDDFVRAIPYGQRIDITALRKKMAADYEASFTCPVTTGRHIRLIVETTLEALNNGEPVSAITPVWRTVDPASHAAKRVPGATDLITEHRLEEGIM